MAYLEWDDSFSVGVDSLDAQHKELIRLINRLHDIEERGGDLTPVLKRLDWYVRHHFSFEEALMAGAAYPRLDEHVVEHRAFEGWLRTGRFALRAGAGETREVAGAINDYLKNWLKKHILVVDMDYKPLLTAQASRGNTAAVLLDELLAALEELRRNPKAEAVERAVALARDLKLAVRGPDGASGPSPES